ncbi:MAG TPA: S8 family serine peptidase [Patescibacteria group bacterium]|nr:S8 family serine peptidase [Patescibacteria group bacterium]
MRRSLSLIAAAALVLSAVGSATAADGTPSASPTTAPIVDPTSDPTASATPDVTFEPADAPERPAEASAETVEPSVSTVPDSGEADVVTPGRATVRGADRSRAASDPTNRWIVVLKAGTDVAAASDRQGRRIGFSSDRTFGHALRGYSAHLDRRQVTALSHDPSVQMIVADERIEVAAQTTPTGIARISANRSPVAKIDGTDTRVDADVAIVDTGIAKVADLNVAGGYNCSTSNRGAWRDVYGHGTHVAGTVGAIDNGSGVVGVAPGVRLWAVKILDDTGSGLLSWYVCGLDWIAAQRDPLDPTRPLFESVNMSVAKWGSDDRNCGKTNKDILHAAICRLVASGVTVVAAAGNDAGSAAARVPAAYNEVITVSALADTDGKAGGTGGNRCYSWGTYDRDDTFADFSNRGSDVDLIAPGKCIWSTVPGGYKYSSGTSMAAPHVAGAVALLKASRPELRPSEVREALQYLGTMNWRWSTDPDVYHEKLLDVSRIGARGTFAVASGPQVVVGETGGPAGFPITVARSSTLFERVTLSAIDLPAGWTAVFDSASLFGFAGVASTLTVTVPFGAAQGTYPLTVAADEHGRRQTTLATVVVQTDAPIAQSPATETKAGSQLGTATLPTRTSWPAATDPSTAVVGYELQSSVDGGTWTTLAATDAAVRTATATHTVGHAYRYRVRARDVVGNWGDWADGPSITGVLVQDRFSAVTYIGSWTKVWSTYASDRTRHWAATRGAAARTTFSGRGVAVVAQTTVGRGGAAVYVDGVYKTTISFRSSVNHERVVLYSTRFASLGTHTIELRASGTGRIDLDAFVILR